MQQPRTTKRPIKFADKQYNIFHLRYRNSQENWRDLNVKIYHLGRSNALLNISDYCEMNARRNKTSVFMAYW